MGGVCQHLRRQSSLGSYSGFAMIPQSGYYQVSLGKIPLSGTETRRGPGAMPPLPKLEETPTPEALVSQAGMRIVRLLVGRPPQSVADLIEASGVH